MAMWAGFRRCVRYLAFWYQVLRNVYEDLLGKGILKNVDIDDII